MFNNSCLIYGKILLTVSICLLSCKTDLSQSNMINGLIDDGDYPGVVKIAYEKDAECTASVLSHNTLLTAAHCLPTSTVNVYLNNGNILQTTKILHHPSYSSDPSHDLAVIVVADGTFNDITPYRIGSKNFPAGTTVSLVGYGCETQVKEVLEKDKKVLRVVCKPNTKLVKKYGQNTITEPMQCPDGMIEIRHSAITDDQIKIPTGKNSYPSRGDSGSPMIVKNIQGPTNLNDATYSGDYIIGVVSLDNTYYGESLKKPWTIRPACYAPVYLNKDMEFFKSAVEKIGANIPSVQ